MNTRIGAAALLSTVSLMALTHPALAGVAVLASVDAADADAVSEVVVTAPRQENQARVVQFKAPNLVAVQAAETIQKYPDFTAAEALGRMPGVSITADTGEGRFVQIRGIDANLGGATYGGVPLLNTNPGGTAGNGAGRAVEFDTIPTGAVDGLVVSYTLLPDHEAEGLGGSIELSPRTAVNVDRPFVDATLGFGYEPLHGHTGPFQGDLAIGARFGFDDKGLVLQNGQSLSPRVGFFSNPTPFSFVLTGSRKDDRRAIDDLEEGYVDAGDANGAPPFNNQVGSYDLRHYDYHRRRFAYGAEFDFQPNEDHNYYVRFNVGGYTEAQKKNFLLYRGFGDQTVDPANANGFATTAQPRITSTDEQEVHRNTVTAIGGSDRWGNVLLDYHGAYSRATFILDRNIGATFQGPKNNPFTYDQVSNQPFPILSMPGVNLNDPSIYKLSGVNDGRAYDLDEEWSGAANLTFPVRLMNEDDRIKVGGELRLRDKSTAATRYSYAETGQPLTAFSGPAIGPYYDGHYTNGPIIDIYSIRALIAGQTPRAIPNGNEQGSENIYAGYVQYTGKIGKLGILAGVRVEDTEARYSDSQTTTDAGGNSTTAFVFRPVSYVDAFPTIQLRYDFTPHMVARATWSTGISRPGINQVSSARSVDFSQSPVLISGGNPNLEPTTGNNFDLDLEYYLPNAGILQLAVFDKEFDNYIVDRVQHNVTTDPLAPGQLATVSSLLNVSGAYARGFTAAYHQKFIWLPKPLDGFGVEANFTYVDSRINEYDAATSLTGRNEYGMLPGTPKWNWNMAAFYEAYGFETRVSAQYVSHSLFGLGGDKTLDTIEDSRFLLDVTMSYKVNSHVTLYANARNLTDQPLRYYEGASNRPIQREFYGITLEGGLRAHF